MHPDQLHVSLHTATLLVRGQFPQWKDLPVAAVASQGTVTALFRVGDRLAARFPLRPASGPGSPIEETRSWLMSEVAAARELLGRTRFPTPEPVAIGEPGADYPLPWSVQSWLPGTVATDAAVSGSTAFAVDLANFVHDVRQIDTAGRTFSGAGRGGHLPDHDAWMEECFTRSDQLFDIRPLRRIWAALRELPRSEPDAMTHGDLTPGNVLVDNGRLAGVIDVGGLGPADPALDLVGGWHLLDAGPREVFRSVLQCDDLEWSRGAAWAFEQAMGAAWYYALTNTAMSTMGRRTLARIAAEAPF